MKWLCVPALLLPIACSVPLVVGEEAVILCGAADDCPAGLSCLVEVGRCVSPTSACVTDDGAAVADGTPCGGDRSCVRGLCVDAACGDGVVQDGEECDPGADRLCRADCTFAFCGDGIVDFGESCDSLREDCVSCIQLCQLTAPADCDGDAANGCECTLPEVLLPEGQSSGSTGASIVGDDVIVTSISPDAQFRVLRASFDGAIEVLASGQQAVVVNVDGETLAWVRDDDASRVLSIGADDVVELDRFDAPLFAFAADAATWYLADVTGIDVIERETGARRGHIDTPVDCFRLTLCEHAIGCDDFSKLSTSRLDGRDTRLVADMDNPQAIISVGCDARGDLAWQDFDGLFVDVDGVSINVATLTLPTDLPLGGRIVALDDALYISGTPFGVATFRFDPETHTPQGVARGVVAGLVGRRLIVFGNSGGRASVSVLDVPEVLP